MWLGWQAGSAPKPLVAPRSAHAAPSRVRWGYRANVWQVGAHGRQTGHFRGFVGTLQEPQFPRPVGERQAQPPQIRMPGADLSLEGGNLATATVDIGALLIALAHSRPAARSINCCLSSWVVIPDARATASARLSCGCCSA